MLFPEVVALGIARAPRCGCMGTQSCGGASQLAGSSFVYFSQEPQADDCLRLEVKERQQCNFIWLWGLWLRPRAKANPSYCLLEIAEGSPTAGEMQWVKTDKDQWAGLKIFFFFPHVYSFAFERHFVKVGVLSHARVCNDNDVQQIRLAMSLHWCPKHSSGANL